MLTGRQVNISDTVFGWEAFARIDGKTKMSSHYEGLSITALRNVM